MILHHRKAFLGALLTASLAGCSASSVTLQQTTIPTPLTDKIPAVVGLRLPADFYDFRHEEEVYGRKVWSIELGQSNANLFTQLFGHMFDKVVVLKEGDEPGQMDLDVLIEPTIDAFEFSVPTQSKTEAFAVWVRYRLSVYDRNGDLATTWPVSAYGKSQTTDMSNDEALQRAAVLAMRDAAALMVMKLDSATGISELIKEEPAALPATTPLQLEAGEDDVQTTALEEGTDETS